MCVFHFRTQLIHNLVASNGRLQNSKIEAAKVWVSSSDLASHAAFVRSFLLLVQPEMVVLRLGCCFFFFFFFFG